MRVDPILNSIALTVLFASLQPCAAQSPKTVRDPNRTFQKRVVSWVELKNQNVVMQQKDYSCGAAAVATVLRYYWGEDVTEADVLSVVERSLRPHALEDRAENGLTMADLNVACQRMGYASTVGSLDSLEKLREAKVPLVISVNLGGTDHFVVFRGIHCGLAFLADPIRGNLRVDARDFEKSWNSKAVFVVTPKGKTSSAVSRLHVREEELLLGRTNNQLIRRELTRVR